MNRGALVAIVAAIVVAVIVLFFALRSPAQVPPEQPDGAEPVVDNTPRPPPKELVIPVTLTKQFFNPANITVNLGDSITFEITSQDLDHVVSVPGYDVSASIAVGEKGTIAFKPTTTGTVQVVCTENCDLASVLTVLVK